MAVPSTIRGATMVFTMFQFYEVGVQYLQNHKKSHDPRAALRNCDRSRIRRIDVTYAQHNTDVNPDALDTNHLTIRAGYQMSDISYSFI